MPQRQTMSLGDTLSQLLFRFIIIIIITIIIMLDDTQATLVPGINLDTFVMNCVKLWILHYNVEREVFNLLPRILYFSKYWK